jgi:hypothetical protein
VWALKDTRCSDERGCLVNTGGLVHKLLDNDLETNIASVSKRGMQHMSETYLLAVAFMIN